MRNPVFGDLRWRVTLLAVPLLAFASLGAQARVVLGYASAEQCQAGNCSYVNRKGACVLAGDGANGLVVILNRAPVKLARKERLAVHRKRPNQPFTPGDRFVSVYDATESAIGGVRVKILDTVIQPAGACPPADETCNVVQYRSRIRIETPRDVIDFHGLGHCSKK